MVKQKNDALESVRKLLEDNQKALDVLDVLKEKNRDYLKKKRYARIIDTAISVFSLVFIFGGLHLFRNGNIVGILVPDIGLATLLGQFICTDYFDGVPKAIFGIEPIELSLCTELDYINDLLFECSSEHVYKELCWDRKGFRLTEVKNFSQQV